MHLQEVVTRLAHALDLRSNASIGRTASLTRSARFRTCRGPRQLTFWESPLRIHFTLLSVSSGRSGATAHNDCSDKTSHSRSANNPELG